VKSFFQQPAGIAVLDWAWRNRAGGPHFQGDWYGERIDASK